MEKYKQCGVLGSADLKKNGLIPPRARLRKGPVVIVECVEKIPCNPCAYACPRGAIKIEGSLINQPVVDFDRCNGCGVCITRCPGLAIFVINYEYDHEHATITLPYEFVPLPEPGDRVACVDRKGLKVCSGKVISVKTHQSFNRCAAITVAVPKRFWNVVRHIRLKG